MWVLIWASLSFAQTVEIVVGGPDTVRVRAMEEPVFVATCRGVLWDLFDPVNKVFEPVASPMCEGMKPAYRIDKDGRLFSLDAALPALPDVGFHVVRPVVVYGVKCRENAPFSLAGCTEIKSVRGPQMVVRNRGSAVPISQPEQQ